MNDWLKQILITSLSLTLFCVLYSQNTSLVFSSLTIEDGLSQNSVSHIMQDSDGMMWFATQVGLDKYEGLNRFTNIKGFSKKLTEQITCLQDYDDNRIFISTVEHSYLIEKRATSYNEESRVENLDKQIPVGIIFIDIEEDSTIIFIKDKIYASPKNLDQSILKKGLSNITINQVVKIKKDVYYLAAKEGLFELNKGELSKNLLEPAQEVTALFYDHSNSILYIGLDNIKVLSLEIEKEVSPKETVQIEVNPKHGHINPSEVSSIYLADTILWIGTNGSGLYLYNLNTSDLEECHENCGQEEVEINSNFVNVIGASRDGVIWIGLGSGGVNYFQKEKQFFKHHFSGEYTVVINDKVEAIYRYNNYALGLYSLKDNSNSLLVGTQNDGIAVVDLKNDFVNKKIISRDGEQGSSEVFCIKAWDKSTLILGTTAGLYTLNTSNIANLPKYYEKAGNFKDAVSILEIDPINNQLWTSSRTSNEIHLFNNEFDSLTTVSFEGEYISLIQHINYANEFYMLVGTTEGLYKVSYKEEEVKKERWLNENFHPICISYLKNEDYIWVGTDRKGLYKIDLKGVVVDSIGEREGLTSDVLYGLIEDNYGNFWTSSNHGIFWVNPTKRLVNHYRKSDGLQGDEYNSVSYLYCEKNRIFFGGTNGVNSIVPKPIIKENREHLYPKIKYELPIEKEENIGYIIYGDKEIKGAPNLPYTFHYLKLTPILGDYHNSENNQFKISLNGIEIEQETDGSYELQEELFTFSTFGIRFIPRSANDLKIEYRTANSDWLEFPMIIINRSFLSWGSLLLSLISAFIISWIAFLFWQNARSWSKIDLVQNKINEIARLESTSQICEVAVHQLVNDLDFDYAVISLRQNRKNN